jgi:uncharacterized membrane protein YhaH (DUF805 family)
MNMMFEPLKKYAQFSGRAQRAEFWQFWLFTVVVSIVFQVLLGAVGGGMAPGATPTGVGMVVALIYLVVMLGLLIPSLAVSFRRLHDTDRSAWWLLIGLIPILGALVLLYFYIVDGTPGPNKFGPDPKGRGAAEVFA